MLVLLGPDGSGKSSVIERVTADLAGQFSAVQYMHLRPKLGLSTVKNGQPVVDPHAQEPRGWLSSVVKVIYFFFDYTLGYQFKLRPMIARSTLVVFDRYYHDMLVDPRRYRYGGPMWFANLVGRFIPVPDIFILLDAPPEVLQARKAEVSLEETKRQRSAYLNLIGSMKNAIVIDATQPLDKVVSDVKKVLLDFVAERTG
jgi:thymidylate kinase